jgi:cytochrome b pre-mRNA-processing protein 3
MLNALRRRAGRRRTSEALLEALSARARHPYFYEELRVADTIDGRFDVLVLHAWLVIERLSAQQQRDLSQALVNGLFVQFDEALREQGAGDMGMGRRMTKMADAFYGRLKAYGQATDEESLASAMLRNVFRGDVAKLESARALAIYALRAQEKLASANLSAGVVDFGPIQSP